MKNTKETFVAKATSLFGNRYDYTDFEFVNMQTKGLVKCNICSNQWMVRPSHHICYETHCPECVKKSKQMTVESFKAKAYELFKDQYDYSNVIELPNGASSKISIRCVKHNSIFKQSIRAHLEGRAGCKDCLSIKFSKTKEECIEELKLKSNFEMINFSKFEYKGDRELVTVTCNKCNTDKTILYTSLKTEGFKCNCLNTRLEQGKESFLFKAKDYLTKYTVLNIDQYNGYLSPLQFKCNEHSIVFEQTPDSITRGYKGCSKCATENNSFDKQNYIKAHKDCVLYLIQLSNEKELFYKIGITHQNVKKRYESLKDYRITILHELSKDSKTILNMEEHIKGSIINNYKYKPNIKFGGHTECFTVEALPKVIRFITDVA